MDVDTEPSTETATLWTALRRARCRYMCEHPGAVLPGDLDRGCPLCGAMLGAVTVYRVASAQNSNSLSGPPGSPK